MRTFLFGLLLALQGSFTGTYKGTQDGVEFTLNLRQEGSKLDGKATAAGGQLTFIVSGSVEGDTAAGELKVEGDSEKLFFRATLKSGGLTLKVSEPDASGRANWAEADTIDFTRTGGAKDPGPTQGKLTKYSKAPIEVLKSGKEYTHPSGGKFRYPASWKLTEGEDFLELTPPDAAEGERILILGDKAEGATDPASAEVVAYLDEQVMGAVPGVKRVGKVERASAGSGKGAFLVWEGKVSGVDAQVRGYITILKGYGIALVAAGPKAAVEARDKQLREIFFTFGWGQGKTDQRLVGTWKHWSYAAASGRESTATVVLGADGRFSYSSSSEMAANYTGTNQYGDQTAWGAMYSRSGSGWSGTWTATVDEITLNFEDGSSETFDYQFKQEGANVFLVTYGADRSKPMEWSRAD